MAVLLSLSVDGLVIGAPNGGHLGWGTVNAEDGYFINGVKLGGGPVMGVVDGSDAKPGEVGELVFANWTTNLALTNNVAADILTITLSAGDWDVAGAAYFQASQSSGSDDLRAWVNTVSRTQPPGDTGGLGISSTTSGGLANIVQVPPWRLLSALTNTVYLSCVANFGSGTMNVQGYVRARRMR